MPFNETTLWAIFDCLIDGSSVMSFGVEDDFDNIGNVRQNRDDEWVPIIHFDWKDENCRPVSSHVRLHSKFHLVLLGDRDLRRHQNVPVVKVSSLSSSYSSPGLF